MKKVLLSVAFLGATFIGAKAQQTFSFEASEGFTLGDINGQNGWTVTGNGQGGFISNQNVSDELASNGVYSLKITGDSNYGPQQNIVMGGFYAFDTPVQNQIFSLDVYVDDVQGQGSDYRFGFVNTAESVWTFFVQFLYDGSIGVLSNDGTQTILADVGNWEPTTWYNLKFGVDGTNAVYYIDGVKVDEVAATQSQLGVSDNMRFVHDNYNTGTAGFAYVDNVRVNMDTFSTEDFTTASFSIYPNPATDFIRISNGVDTIENVTITDLNGRIVKQTILDANQQINISDLAQGVYILNATSNGKTITEKIVKK